jgi:hypothetical protein
VGEDSENSQLDRIALVWQANEWLWNDKIVPQLLAPLEKEGGIRWTGTWEHVLVIAFGRSLKTFESVQLLSDPRRPRYLWDDAFVLTRSLYETFVTLEWARASTDRAQMVLDEFTLKLAHFVQHLRKDRLNPEQILEIFADRDAVIQRHGRGPGALSLLPSLEDRVRTIAESLKERHPNLEWEYESYYRDVSGIAHMSGWGLVLSMSGETVRSSPRTGYNAVLCNGLWIFRILNCWNRTFRRIADDTLNDWLTEWAKRAGISESKL